MNQTEKKKLMKLIKTWVGNKKLHCDLRYFVISSVLNGYGILRFDCFRDKIKHDKM